MRISEVLAAVNERHGTDIPDGEKIRWLSNLDHRIRLEVMDQYVGAEDIYFKGYTEETAPSKELLISAPYDEMYLYYIAAKIHYENEEMVRYNNAITMFNEVFENFRKQYHRTHKVKPVKIKFF